MVEQLTEKSLPFFIYAVEHIPLSEQEETELHDLKKMLPEAAILFIKAEIGNETKIFGSLFLFETRIQNSWFSDSKQGFKNVNSCFSVSKQNLRFGRMILCQSLHEGRRRQ